MEPKKLKPPKSQPSTEAEPVSQSTPTDSSAPKQPSSCELEHLQALNLSAFETVHAPAEGELLMPGMETAPTVLTKDQFFEQVFCGLHEIGGAMTGLKSLPVKDDEMRAARAASDAIYETAEETPFLRFLIEPSNKWLQRSFVIYAFGAPKYKAVKAEIQERKQSTKEVKQ